MIHLLPNKNHKKAKIVSDFDSLSRKTNLKLTVQQIRIVSGIENCVYNYPSII